LASGSAGFTAHTAFCTCSSKAGEPEVAERTATAMPRGVHFSCCHHWSSIGQYTIGVGGLAMPSSRSSPTTPTISRQGWSGPCLIRLPSASEGDFQYSRANASLTMVTRAIP